MTLYAATCVTFTDFEKFQVVISVNNRERLEHSGWVLPLFIKSQTAQNSFLMADTGLFMRTTLSRNGLWFAPAAKSVQTAISEALGSIFRGRSTRTASLGKHCEHLPC